jgi:hypothetical protein
MKGDTVIFDSKSGPSRLISGYLDCASFTMTPGTGPITTSGIIAVWGGGITINGTFNQINLRLSGNSGATTPSVGGAPALVSCSPGTTVQFLWQVDGSYWRLQNDLTVTGDTYIFGDPDGPGPSTFDIANGVTLRSGSITGSSSAGSYGNFSGWGGTIEVTGATSKNPNPYQASVGGTTVNPVVAMPTGFIRVGTLRLTDTSTATKYVMFGMASYTTVNDYPSNVVLATGNATRSGGVYFTKPLNIFLSGTFDVGKGNKVVFQSTYVVSAGNWIIDGAGNYTQITSSGTASACYLRKAAAGEIAANYAIIGTVNMTAATTPATPATTLRAVNSIDSGNNTGVTFVTLNSRFLPFF